MNINIDNDLCQVSVKFSMDCPKLWQDLDMNNKEFTFFGRKKKIKVYDGS